MFIFHVAKSLGCRLLLALLDIIIKNILNGILNFIKKYLKICLSDKFLDIFIKVISRARMFVKDKCNYCTSYISFKIYIFFFTHLILYAAHITKLVKFIIVFAKRRNLYKVFFLEKRKRNLKL